MRIPPPGFEPGSPDPKSCMIDRYTTGVSLTSFSTSPVNHLLRTARYARGREGERRLENAIVSIEVVPEGLPRTWRLCVGGRARWRCCASSRQRRPPPELLRRSLFDSEKKRDYTPYRGGQITTLLGNPECLLRAGQQAVDDDQSAHDQQGCHGLPG
jgi:hypothetical protein